MSDEDKPSIRKLPFQESGTCKHCGARLLWISTTETGQRIPLDYDGERLWVTESGTAPMKAKQRIARTSHFDTCKGRRA